MNIRETIITILIDETMSRLPDKAKRKDYVFKEIRKVHKHHYKYSRQNISLFNKCYTMANEVWLMTQKEFLGHGLEFSNVLMLKFIMQDECWVVKKLKLSYNSFEKLEQSYDLSKHNLRTKKIVNRLLENVDIVMSYEAHRSKK